jgi:DNA-directed RNA polymerase sigma subunit (sigma70/sigma32)|tara:strand:- start:55 stop:282 length:228 start_codon:yes stop_codon:yes gene_type:complete
MSKQRDVKSRVADAALKQMLRAADPGREYTSTEIASATGLSRQRINQIEQQALRKIRTFGGKRILSELILELRKK